MSCPFILTRGTRKGEECGRFLVGTFCKIHELSKDSNGCSFILTRGTRKGEKCNKKIKENEEFCYNHDKNIEYNKCEVVISRGIRKGQVCERRCKEKTTKCSVHKEIEIDENDTDNRCTSIITRGIKKGEKCNRKVHSDTQFCKNHQVVNEEKNHVINIEISYNTSTDPNNRSEEIDEKEIILSYKGELEISPQYDFIRIKNIRKSKKITDTTKVFFKEDKFYIKNTKGKYNLNDLLFSCFYIYNLCSENKEEIIIKQIRLENNVLIL